MADIHTLVSTVAQPADNCDVALRIQPVAAGGALRARHAITPLPGAKRIGRNPGLTRHCFGIEHWRHGELSQQRWLRHDSVLASCFILDKCSMTHSSCQLIAHYLPTDCSLGARAVQPLAISFMSHPGFNMAAAVHRTHTLARLTRSSIAGRLG